VWGRSISSAGGQRVDEVAAAVEFVGVLCQRSDEGTPLSSRKGAAFKGPQRRGHWESTILDACNREGGQRFVFAPLLEWKVFAERLSSIEGEDISISQDPGCDSFTRFFTFHIEGKGDSGRGPFCSREGSIPGIRQRPQVMIPTLQPFFR